MKLARYKVYYGGRGGLKSWGFAEALIRTAQVRPVRVICARETQSSIEDSVHHLLKKTINRLGLTSWFTITKTSIVNKAGAEFKFKGLREASAEDIKSFEDADICWVEEAKNVSATSWDFLIPTIRKEGSEIWVSFNPEDESDPCYKRFVKKPIPGSIVHKLNYDQNPFFPKVLEDERQYYLSLIEQADNETERAQAQSNYDHIWLGEFKKINQAIVFSGKWIEKSFPEDLWEQAKDGRLQGADFGFAQDPSTLISGFMLPSPDKLDRMDLYIEHEAWGVGIEITDMPEFYDKIPDSRKWAIKADGARPETISHIKGEGFKITAADKWAGSVEDGITHIKGFNKVYIHPRCRHTIDEAKLYSYKRNKAGEVLPILLDKNNHCWDAIRYMLDGLITRKGNISIWEKLAA